MVASVRPSVRPSVNTVTHIASLSCLSVISGHMQLIKRMRSIGFLGSSHYILRMADPDSGFTSMSEGKKNKIKFLGQLVSEDRKIKKGKLTDFQ